ncbi:hypothetical protein [Telluribacter humicola]|uniref:hypothetical protein n=1 Tax=Telluribacter humicola TaxID=1720261 RepID=UPI001A972472|nr:hypothetical protein [Telluribacter humicola]
MLKLNPDAFDLMKRTTANGMPKPFSIVFVTADRARNTGGDTKRLEKVVLSDRERSGSRHNRTINVRPLGTNDYVKVHLDLILYLNDQPIA